MRISVSLVGEGIGKVEDRWEAVMDAKEQKGTKRKRATVGWPAVRRVEVVLGRQEIGLIRRIRDLRKGP